MGCECCSSGPASHSHQGINNSSHSKGEQRGEGKEGGGELHQHLQVIHDISKKAPLFVVAVQVGAGEWSYINTLATQW